MAGLPAESVKTMIEWIAIFLVIFGLLVGAAWFFRSQLSGGTVTSRERRIGLSEVTQIDGNRKLLLIYRDGVEHLVMTGGPIDLVIEQNIGQSSALPKRNPYENRPAPAPSFGQAANPGAMIGSPPSLAPEGDSNSVTGRLRQRLTQPNLDPQ
jgi:flagellar protein FliO/FliZ